MIKNITFVNKNLSHDFIDANLNNKFVNFGKILV